MKILAYVIVLLLSILVCSVLRFIIGAILISLSKKKNDDMHDMQPSFFGGLLSGVSVGFVVIVFSKWFLSWFNLPLTLLFIVLFSIYQMFNIGNPFKKYSSGFWIGYLVSIIFLYSGSTNQNIIKEKKTSFIQNESQDCEEVKSECLDMIRKKGPEYINSFFYKDLPSGQIDTLNYFRESFATMNEFDDKEKYLRENCPETYEEYKDEARKLISLYLLKTLIE